MADKEQVLRDLEAEYQKRQQMMSNLDRLGNDYQMYEWESEDIKRLTVIVQTEQKQTLKQRVSSLVEDTPFGFVREKAQEIARLFSRSTI